MNLRDLNDYRRRHLRVRRLRGKAGQYRCRGRFLGLPPCGRQARHWATLHGRDGWDIADYAPLCPACHAAYDKAGQIIITPLSGCPVCEPLDNGRSVCLECDY